MGLPEERNGFTAYYQVYPDEITNQSFRAHITLKSGLCDGENSLQAPTQKIQLCDTVDKSDGEYLVKNKTFSKKAPPKQIMGMENQTIFPT